MKYIKALQVGMYLLNWIAESSRDGRITSDEILEGLQGALQQFNIGVKIDL